MKTNSQSNLFGFSLELNEAPVPLPRPRFSRGQFPMRSVVNIIERGINSGLSARTIAELIKDEISEQLPQVRKDPRQIVYASKLQEAFLRSAAESSNAAIFPTMEAVHARLKVGVMDLSNPGDVDNHAKAVFDALTGYVWVDDAQVDALVVIRQKHWTGLSANFKFG